MSFAKVHIFEVGYCLHPQALTWPGKGWKPHRYPSTAALIIHSRLGPILFDTGYASAFFTATRCWPERAYALSTPVTLPPEQELSVQLQKIGLQPSEIETVVLSHFHADHIAGIHQFTKAKFVYLNEGYQQLVAKNRLMQVKSGFLKALLPTDFLMRASTFSIADFRTSLEFFAGKLQFIDLFGQQDVKLIHLPGHAEGHIGLYVEQEEKPYFLLADASWHLQSLRQKQLPSMAAQLIFSNSKEYRQTFMTLSDLVNQYLHVHWLPCHCSVAKIQSI